MQNYPDSSNLKINCFCYNISHCDYNPVSSKHALKRAICSRTNLLIPNTKERIEHGIRKALYFDDRQYNVDDKVAIRDNSALNTK